MSRLTWPILGALIAAIGIAVPATGADGTLKRLFRLDSREARHYKDLDRRVRALSALALTQRIRSNVVFQVLQPAASSPRFFAGRASCPAGQTLSGGGVDWGSSAIYPGWQVAESAPDALGSSWTATLYNGSNTASPTLPRVYAVCLKL